MPVNSAMVPPERTHDNYENWALHLSLFRSSVMVLPYPPRPSGFLPSQE